MCGRWRLFCFVFVCFFVMVERECGCVEVVDCFCSFVYLCLINLFVARPGVTELLIVVI